MSTTPSAAALAGEIAEQVRALNHATLPAEGYPGLVWVADVYEVLNALREAANRLQQTALQTGAFLAHAADTAQLGVDAGPFVGNPDAAMHQACSGLHRAESLFAELGLVLDETAQAIAWVSHRPAAADGR